MADSTDAVSSNTSVSGAGNQMDMAGPAPLMEGFGNAYYMTNLNYGSVNDGALYQPTLEQKLRKQYWKTKQAMIQKLGKSQDEFVVAGDAEIDTKLEKAYHLQTSCAEILDALEQCATSVQALSNNEQYMGGYLCTYCEDEPTQASSVMKAVGVVQEKVAKQRMEMMPSLLRLHNEFVSFLNNALTDLSYSIQRLEKARTDYRAALLWMRDVSAKLQNPDHRDELVKFRQVQAQVKDAKKVFERLKYDLSEKIDMVAASRCNLISCSLPYYQKSLLTFLDHSASDYHSVLETLRTYNRDQHQYQESKLVEEIRDLELAEPFASEPLSPVHPPDQSHRLALQGSDGGGTEEEDDEMLLDVGSAQTSSRAPARPGGGGDTGVVKTKDSPPAQGVVDELKDLLKMDDDLLMLGGMEDLAGGETPGSGDDGGRGGEDEWGNFSSFMRDSTEVSVSSDWEKEFADAGPQTQATTDELLMSSEVWQQLQPPPTAGAQPVIPPTSDSGVPSSKTDISLPAGGRKPSSAVSSSVTSKAIDGTMAFLQTQPPPPHPPHPPTESTHMLLEVGEPIPPSQAGPEPTSLQELLGINLSLTPSLPPPMMPSLGNATILSATPVRTAPQNVAPVNAAPLNVVPSGTAVPAPLNVTLDMTSLGAAPLSMASLKAAWSTGVPSPADAHPPPTIGGSPYTVKTAGPFQPMGTAGPFQPMGTAGPFQPMGTTGPFQPMGTAGPFQPVGTTGPFQPVGTAGPFQSVVMGGSVGMTGPVWLMGVSGPPPLPSVPMGALPILSASRHAKAATSAAAVGPKQKEGSKGNTTAWMSVFAHLDPLVNEKA